VQGGRLVAIHDLRPGGEQGDLVGREVLDQRDCADEHEGEENSDLEDADQNDEEGDEDKPEREHGDPHAHRKADVAPVRLAFHGGNSSRGGRRRRVSRGVGLTEASSYSFSFTDERDAIQDTLDAAVSGLRAAGAPGALAFGVGPWGARFSASGVDSFGGPLRPAAPIEVASVTKTFVAAVVLLLAEDGALKLDDALRTYLPELVRDDAGITVRSLLNHTSGLPDYFEDEAFRAAWLENPARDWTARELLEVAAGLPRHELGVFRYSSLNYVLVGLVIEFVTGRTVAEALRTRVVEPLELDATHLPGTAAAAPGRLTSTAGDVARFLAALMRGEAVNDASRREMLSTVPSDWPESQGYGLGIERVESLMGAESPCGAAWGHLGFGPATTVALTTPDASRQLVVTTSMLLTDEKAWAELGRAVWAILCPRTEALHATEAANV
jgi:D-alanyl-D-alanine carboxypeptidase